MVEVDDIVRIIVQVAVEFRTVSLSLDGCSSWTVVSCPAVEFVAPSAEPVLRKRALDDRFDHSALFETGFRSA